MSVPEEKPELEISLEEVLNQLSDRGQQEWGLAMKRAEIAALENALNSSETPVNRDS